MSPPALRVLSWNLMGFKRLWRANVVSSFLQPLLYVLGMGLGVGRLVDSNTPSNDILGASYVEFLAPALLATTAMMASTSESSYPVFDGFAWSRHYHAMGSTPLSPLDIVTGHALWIALRTAGACTAVALVMSLLPDARSWGLVPAVACAVLCGLAFAMPVAAFASTRRTDGAFAALQRIVVIPLFLFGGAFFPVGQLPAAMRPLAYASPLWHGIELCRGFALGTLGGAEAAGHVLYLAAWAVVGGALAVRTFATRLYA